ncbi:hypothetical protein [Lapillicoccus jejuensis]|nr:hypothetical protein [Lapillicoccus jejuensis]
MPRLHVPGRPSRTGLFRRRRRVPVGTRDFLEWSEVTGPGPTDDPDDDGGLAGVREPRRPRPTLPSAAMALQPPVEDGRG